MSAAISAAIAAVTAPLQAPAAPGDRRTDSVVCEQARLFEGIELSIHCVVTGAGGDRSTYPNQVLVARRDPSTSELISTTQAVKRATGLLHDLCSIVTAYALPKAANPKLAPQLLSPAAVPADEVDKITAVWLLLMSVEQYPMYTWTYKQPLDRAARCFALSINCGMTWVYERKSHFFVSFKVNQLTTLLITAPLATGGSMRTLVHLMHYRLQKEDEQLLVPFMDGPGPLTPAVIKRALEANPERREAMLDAACAKHIAEAEKEAAKKPRGPSS